MQAAKSGALQLWQGALRSNTAHCSCTRAPRTIAPPTPGTFLRGVLDKVGVEPQIERIGKFKSAGDQLLRSTMSTAQREQLQVWDGGRACVLVRT